MKKLLLIGLLAATPVYAQQSTDSLICQTTKDCACKIEATRDAPQTRGFKLAKRPVVEDKEVAALKRVRASLVARNPRDKLIAVIDKALAK